MYRLETSQRPSRQHGSHFVHEETEAWETQGPKGNGNALKGHTGMFSQSGSSQDLWVIHPPIHLFIHPRYPSSHLPIHQLPIYPLANLSLDRFIHSPTHPSVHPPCPSIHPFTTHSSTHPATQPFCEFIQKILRICYLYNTSLDPGFKKMNQIAYILTWEDTRTFVIQQKKFCDEGYENIGDRFTPDASGRVGKQKRSQRRWSSPPA